MLAGELDVLLVTGSWRRLVFANPEPPAGVADHRAYVFCVLEAVHRGLRRREIYAQRADRWGDPPGEGRNCSSSPAQLGGTSDALEHLFRIAVWGSSLLVCPAD